VFIRPHLAVLNFWGVEKKMGLFDTLSTVISSATGMGSASLKDAYLDKKAPTGSGHCH